MLSNFAFSFCMWRCLGVLLTIMRSSFVITQDYATFYRRFVVAPVIIVSYVEWTLTAPWWPTLLTSCTVWVGWKCGSGKCDTVKNARVENTGVKNSGADSRGGKCRSGKCGNRQQGWKMQEWKNREQIAGVENAGVENAGVDSRGGKCRSGKIGNR